MKNRGISHRVFVQSETICITTAFLFLIGLVQVMMSLAMRYVQPIHFQWFLYPEWSAGMTLIPFMFGILYCGTRKPCTVVLVCVSLLMTFAASIVYIVFVVLDLFSVTQSRSSQKSFLLSDKSSEKALTLWDFVPFAILILALVQSLLAFASAILTFAWSQCCQPCAFTQSYGKFNSNPNAVRRLLNPGMSNQQQHIYQSGNGGLASSPLLTMRRATLGRPTYCSDTLRSMHRAGVNMNPTGAMSTHYGGANGVDDPNDIYMARNIIRRAADEV
ncbi:hypothetical protein ACOME3_001763 [Neoechinorhynchus agilis]